MPEDQVASLLHSILDAGITLIDTARGYGLSEERIGKHLKNRRREFVLSTKIGYGIPGYQDWTGPCMTAGIETALQLLQTDVIDIVHLHSCPLPTLQQDEILDALCRAREAGKIKSAAYSGDNEPFDWALQSGRFNSLQTSINVCDQRAIPAAAYAEGKGIGIIAKRPLANTPWGYPSFPSVDDSAAQSYWNRWNIMALDAGRHGSIGNGFEVHGFRSWCRFVPHRHRQRRTLAPQCAVD